MKNYTALYFEEYNDGEFEVQVRNLATEKSIDEVKLAVLESDKFIGNPTTEDCIKEVFPWMEDMTTEELLDCCDDKYGFTINRIERFDSFEFNCDDNSFIAFQDDDVYGRVAILEGEYDAFYSFDRNADEIDFDDFTNQLIKNFVSSNEIKK